VTRTRVSLPLTLFLLVILGSMTFMAFDFSAQSRRVPIVVGVPTTALLLVQLVRDGLALRRGVEPGGGGEYGEQETTAAYGQASAEAQLAASATDGADATQVTAPPVTTSGAAAAPRASVGQSFAWVLFLGFAFYVFGMLLAVPVFVGSFMYFYGRESWKVILISVLATAGVLHFFFVVLLGIRLYPGIVGPMVGL